MTNVLAVETSSDLCSVALYRNGEVFDVTEKAPREHTQKLLPMIDKVLGDNDLTVQELDAIAFGRGPGSFTGLRISLGMVQGLAYGLDIPLIPVSTLEAIAAQSIELLNCKSGDCLLVANDARMNEVYGCLYQCVDGRAVAVTEESVLRPEDFLKQPDIAQLVPGSFCALGDAWALPPMTEFLGQGSSHAIQATAPGILPLALERLANGDTVDAEGAQPSYLRDTVAWKKRERIRQQ